MEVFLLRHAEAVEAGAGSAETDDDRSLTGDGARMARLCGRALARLQIPFAAIYSSPLRRARQTSEIVAEALALGWQVNVMEELGHEFSCASVAGRLESENPEGIVLLVGHVPALERLASYWLTGDEAGVRIPFKKAGLCHLSFTAGPERGKARLRRMLSPDLWPALAGE